MWLLKKMIFYRFKHIIMNQRFFIFLSLLLATFFFSCNSKSEQSANKTDATSTKNESTMNATPPAYTLVIHGGAGTMSKQNITPEKEKQVLDALNKALDTGEAILKNGGSALDAVEQTIMVLENAPYFNAGKGAVFTNAGKNEMDASFMDGSNRNAGAVGGVTIVKNPIRAARAVMEKSAHVLLTGEGANEFAREQNIETVDPSYFHTDSRWESLQKAKAREKQTGEHLPTHSPLKYGTVGCAALDKNGNLAAGTSTGGMTNKRYNRLGDSPIIGAGTYANNNTCAISSTGHGEFFIRFAVAYDISAMMEYKEMPFQKAADFVINDKLKAEGGSGGIIGVDKYGNVAMPFNTEGMYRGYIKPGDRAVKIFK